MTDLLTQIGKAVRLLDLKDHVEGAIATLKAVVEHLDSEVHLPIKLEAKLGRERCRLGDRDRSSG